MEIVGRPGFYGLLSHSGSRGTGAKVGDHYIKLAKDVCPGNGIPDGYHWIPADTDAGREYWMVMNLMGRYAQACHRLIHARFAIASGDAIERSPVFYSLGREGGFPMLLETEHTIMAQVDGKKQGVRVSLLENHHNFAWKETWAVGDVYIHRKGATPAAAGQWGIIPGSSGSYSYVVEGKYGEPGCAYETANLNSASHGAGRPRSRSASKAIHNAAAYTQATQKFGVQHDGVAPDETVFAYKDIEDVMAAGILA